MKRGSVVRALALGGVSITAIGAMALQASAQSVDYGALEQLYGEPVTTSATGKPQKASDAPANMTIIDADDIRRSGATTIPDILRFVTGIDVRQYSAGQAEVAVRGYNQSFNPRLLVLVNGRQVYLDDFGYVSWSLIPVQLEEIRQIEVVKGPNSALFGFNAASGVINIITYDPLFDSVNAGTVRFGSQALMQGSAVATAHVGDNVGARMSIGGLQRDEFKVPSGPALPMHHPQDGTFNIDGKARPATGLEITLGASVATVQQNDTLPFGGDTHSSYHTNSVKAGISADTAWGTIAVDAYRNWLGFTETANTTTLTDVVYVLQASDTLRLNENNIVRLGLEYRNSSAQSAFALRGTVGYAVYSASAMWDWQISPALSFTNALRVDYLALNYAATPVPGGFAANAYNTTLVAYSFNSGLVYKVTNLDTIRLTAGRGLQLPSLADYFIAVPVNPSGVAVLGSPTLQPTAVWNLELGYDRSIPSLGSVVTSSVFVQRNENLLALGGSTFPQPLPSGLFATVSQNIGYSDAVGGELGIKGLSASGFRWNASYAFEVIRDYTTINKIARTSSQDYQAGTPTSVVVLGAGYTWEKLEIDAQARWQSRFTDYRFTRFGYVPVYVSDYVTSVARVGYNLTDHLTLALTGQQLNVSRLMQSVGPPVERSIIGSATVHF